MKTLLLHITDDAANATRMAFALDIARRTRAHLDCLATRPDLSLTLTDPWGGVLVTGELMAMLDEQRRALRERIEARLAHEDVSWSYDERASDPAGEVVAAARLADAVIIGRGSGIGFAGDVATSVRAPVLIPPEGLARFDPATAMIAWNGSDEAAAALKSAVPILRMATRVSVVAVGETGQAFTAEDACRYLSRHDIHAEAVAVPQSADFPEVALLREQERLGADLVVMGAYGHSRMRQFLLGGVTRRMLADCPATLLLAH